MTLRTRENRARRRAARLGLNITKSRIRRTNIPGYGGYIVADCNNHSVLGTDYFAFSAELSDVEALLDSWEARERDELFNNPNAAPRA